MFPIFWGTLELATAVRSLTAQWRGGGGRQGGGGCDALDGERSGLEAIPDQRFNF